MFAPTELYNDGTHICISFSDLVNEGPTEAVQANQFLVIDNGDDALIDPGGNMTYHALYMTMSRYVPAETSINPATSRSRSLWNRYSRWA